MNEREEIRRRVRELVGGRPVRWVDRRTSRLDFEGWEWTLEAFDVPQVEWRPLTHQLASVFDAVYERHGVSIRVLFHDPEATTRHYAWVRETGGDVPEPTPEAGQA